MAVERNQQVEGAGARAARDGVAREPSGAAERGGDAGAARKDGPVVVDGPRVTDSGFAATPLPRGPVEAASRGSVEAASRGPSEAAPRAVFATRPTEPDGGAGLGRTGPAATELRAPAPRHAAGATATGPRDLALDPTLPFTAPWLLAPMEGVTDPAFRELVLERNSPRALGGTFTEFVRVARQKVPAKVVRRHLGERRFEAPCGLQLMGSDLALMAESAREVVSAGAVLLDLNFGCPAKGALRGCAGSAVLREPEMLRAIVAACVEAVEGAIPVTAKIRAGFENAELVEELAAAAEAGGARLLTIHCRTKAEGYQTEVDWSRIARAVGAVSIPVCGNGSIASHADLERMRRETGCRYAMVGRASLGDPWIFSGREVEASEAALFLYDYARILTEKGVGPPGSAARVKQLVRKWRAGGLFDDERLREQWMRTKDPEELLGRVAERAGREAITWSTSP